MRGGSERYFAHLRSSNCYNTGKLTSALLKDIEHIHAQQNLQKRGNVRPAYLLVVSGGPGPHYSAGLGSLCTPIHWTALAKQSGQGAYGNRGKRVSSCDDATGVLLMLQRQLHVARNTGQEWLVGLIDST